MIIDKTKKAYEEEYGKMIKISGSVTKRLSSYGKFEQTYSDVIEMIIDRLELLEGKK